MKTMNVVLCCLMISSGVVAQSDANGAVKREAPKTSVSKIETPSSGVIHYSQDQTNQPDQQYPIEMSVGRDGVQHIHDKAYYQTKIEEIDYTLQAIKIKKDYILSNPEEKEIATNNGWFENMRQVEEQLNAEKQQLIQKIALLEH